APREPTEKKSDHLQVNSTNDEVAPLVVPYDEMFGPSGVRGNQEPLLAALTEMGPNGLSERARLRDAYLDQQGITFTLSGRERPLPLDLVPRLITAPEWQRLEEGVAQRIRALEFFLADVYGRGHVLDEGVVPRSLVTSSKHFHRDAWGLVPPNGVRIHVAGVDLI